jgi:hypothetical protein
VLVVLASRHEGRPRALVDRWAGYGASLLTCEDLSVAGWRHDPGAPQVSTAVIGGHTVAVREIAGVLIRLPWVREWEFSHIVPLIAPTSLQK